MGRSLLAVASVVCASDLSRGHALNTKAVHDEALNHLRSRRIAPARSLLARLISMWRSRPLLTVQSWSSTRSCSTWVRKHALVGPALLTALILVLDPKRPGADVDGYKVRTHTRAADWLSC